MRFDSFYGQSPVVHRLRTQLNEGAIVHAFLFTGPEGCGKKTLARLCAQAWLCAGKSKPCGVCGSCLRVQNGQHPDYIEVWAEKSELSVDEARDLIDMLSMRPYESPRRSVLIFSPMNFNAQNALLKSFEEPPEGTAFFVVAQQTTKLLPTVLSRMQIIRLAPLDHKTCVRALREQGFDPKRAEQFASLSGGALGRALMFSRDDSYIRMRELAFALLEPLAPEGLPDALGKVKGYSRQQTTALLGCISEILADLTRVRAGAHPFATDKTDWLFRMSEQLDERALCALQDKALAAARQLVSNGTPQGAMETFLFEWVKETQGWQS